MCHNDKVYSIANLHNTELWEGKRVNLMHHGKVKDFVIVSGSFPQCITLRKAVHLQDSIHTATILELKQGLGSWVLKLRVLTPAPQILHKCVTQTAVAPCHKSLILNLKLLQHE